MSYDSLAETMSADYGKYSETAVRIVELFEDLLEENGIMIPDDDRPGDEGEAPIYGCTWANLVDQVAEYLREEFGG